MIEHLTEVLPDGIDTARVTVNATHAFYDRAMHYLAGEASVREFVDIGMRLPSGARVHEVAHEIAPDARVLYVIDDDVVVVAHANLLQVRTSEGDCVYTRGSLRDPDELLRNAVGVVDFTRPVGILIQGALHQLHDDELAYHTVARLLAEASSGSYLVISHLASDLLGGAMTEALRRLERMVKGSKMEPLAVRSQAEVSRFFDGLELMDPGVVPVDQWRPDESSPTPPDKSSVFMYGAIGRKP